ncbi:MAG: AEC family transporter [Nocardioidaceae bacterium]|nr:AEC family transporter [Nocardioidaceae bacterium]
MQGVLEGFSTIGIVIVLGFLLAHFKVVGAESQLLLSRLVIFVATPALLFRLLSRADVAAAFSSNLVVAAASAVTTAAVYVAVARRVWQRETPDIVVGALSSAYVNAGNLGLPIAVYVLGDGAYVAPTLLLQLVVFTPTAFAILDTSAHGRRPSVGRALGQPFRNPITVASLLGLAMALTHWPLSGAVTRPLDLVGAMAVPGALLAYGISLRLGPRPMNGDAAGEVVLVTLLKLVFQPGVAYLLGSQVFGLEGQSLLAVTLIAGLPTAQNIFIYATRYGRGSVLARDAIFVTTMLSVPALLIIAAVLA